jgi:preprotein translocase subunit SecG
LQALLPYLNVAQILVAALLIVLVLLQTRGSGMSSGFSSDTSIYRTRRGVERTIFQLTIGIGVVYVILAIISVIIPRFGA